MDDWPIDAESDPLHTPGLIHKFPMQLRLVAAFFRDNKPYLVALLLILSAMIATLISAGAGVHAGYMMLMMLLMVAFNYIVTRAILYEHAYHNARNLSTEPHSDSDHEATVLDEI